jgi:hypothetical protein
LLGRGGETRLAGLKRDRRKIEWPGDDLFGVLERTLKIRFHLEDLAR